MSEEKIQQEEQKAPPTKEELIKFFQEQIEVKKVQYNLQELNTKLAVARAEEMKALSFIAQLTNPQPQGGEYEGGTPHTITQEDIDNNPELVEQGISVGDEVIIPSAEKPKKERSLKRK
jgi:hypothetical protein